MRKKILFPALIGVAFVCQFTACKKSTPAAPMNPLNNLQVTIDSVSSPVDYSITTSEFLNMESQSGIWDFIGDTISVTDNAPTSGQANVTFIRVKFANSISTDTALLYLKYKGLHPATLRQLRLYLLSGANATNIESNYYALVAAGSVTSGGQYVNMFPVFGPILINGRIVRGITLISQNTTWETGEVSDAYFLAIR